MADNPSAYVHLVGECSAIETHLRECVAQHGPDAAQEGGPCAELHTSHHDCNTRIKPMLAFIKGQCREYIYQLHLCSSQQADQSKAVSACLAQIEALRACNDRVGADLLRQSQLNAEAVTRQADFTPEEAEMLLMGPGRRQA
ncbi:hypothetical protein H696_05183 [Fonticula alba]|uniref:Uncharacterized protein n=1 Tax=Fonticula alba TaxID=691883 RepID=A0A058Z296_FONAL|nr:hypothetical protein H696_05183 [Fonticula alba]KCV68261.1 hypothetical protein H696_05183 [Fonticula alba]|eukprot:XP_009497315.1 hypothetical protein H696_05183 [Fonticula alba]